MLTPKMKFALPVAGIAALVAFAAFLLLMRNVDNLVRQTIETSASAATGTPVHIDDVSLSLREGRGTIRGLTIANPPGFSETPLLSLDSIDIRLDPTAITATVPLIEEIRVGPGTFHYEVNQRGENNLRVIQKHARHRARTSAASAPSQEANRQPERRFRIKRLTVAEGLATLDLGRFGSGQGTARIPEMTLTDLGGEQGATAGELSEEIVQALGKNLATVTGGGALDRLGDSLNEAYRKLLNR